MAQVSVQTEVENQAEKVENIILRHTLFEWNRKGGKGRKVQTGAQEVNLRAGEKEEVVQMLTVERPRLWCPEAPNLYLLVTELVENGKVIDREETRIGIRHIEMTREQGFVINGKPLRLVGSNRHMEYPYVGNAISDNAQYRDIYQIRSNGFNIVRLGHYPQDPSVLDACDELGLLAIEPIPGWQFFNKNPLFAELTYRDVRHTIRRDRNHPSVVMWETTLNESWPPKEWKDRAVEVAHEEFPSNQCFTSGDAYGYEGFDVSYNDWEEGFNRPNKTKNPGFIREYYDYEFGGHYSTTRIRRGDGEQAQIQNAWNAQWSHNRYRAYYPWTMGDAVCSMYDYNLDAILSFPRLLMEMLVFTEPGRIELLPAWPAAYPDGSIKGVRLYGGHTLDLIWKEGKLVKATLLAGSDEEVEWVNGDDKKTLKLQKGKVYAL